MVDLAAKTDACSPQEVTGDEHLYEHVHFNIRGAYRVAYDLCEAIESDLRRRGIEISIGKFVRLVAGRLPLRR